MADALKAAMEMGEDERRERLRTMREVLRDQDIFWWVDYYLTAALGTVPDDFRVPKEYVPEVDLDAVWVDF
jgi:trehalose 6-phosphate synthase